MTTELTVTDILALIDAEIERYDAMDHQYSRGDGQQALVLELLKTKILEAKIARVESADVLPVVVIEPAASYVVYSGTAYGPIWDFKAAEAYRNRYFPNGLVRDGSSREVKAAKHIIPTTNDEMQRTVESATLDVPAPRVPDALVPIHGDPLDGLRKAIEGHAALSKLEAMTKLYEIQRMAKDIISSDFGSVTPQVVIRLRGLRIEEMGPSDCVIELIKLAEMLAPGMMLSAAQVTAPIPSLDSAAAKVKLSKAQQAVVDRLKAGWTITAPDNETMTQWHKPGSMPIHRSSGRTEACPIKTLYALSRMGIVQWSGGWWKLTNEYLRLLSMHQR